MMRSLWTAASGMTTQQLNVDTIANNLSNVNTTGYKKETAEFKTLLYQTIQTKTTSANGENKPVGAQVGLGVRNSSITSHFTQGALNATSNTLGVGISGDGFFCVQNANGETCYTRNGDFKLGVTNDGFMLCTSEGYPVLDDTGAPIEFSSDYVANKLTRDTNGQICYPDASNNPQPIGVTIGLVQFTNASGLNKVGSSLYMESDASGEPLNESENTDLKKSELRQGYLEASNVDVVDEMVNLIVAQRAYEMNSKAITTSDDMLSQANNLKR